MQTSIVTASPARLTFSWVNDLIPSYAAAERAAVNRRIRRTAAAMIAESLDSTPAPELEQAPDWSAAYADDDLPDLDDDDLYGEAVEWGVCPDGDRCDYDGCVTGRRNQQAIAAVEAEQRADRLADYQPSDDMLAGLDFATGAASFDPDEIQWGFRVTALDKAPGVTSGRPQPYALALANQ